MRRVLLASSLLVGALGLSACGGPSGESGARAQLAAWVHTTAVGDTVAGLQQDSAKIDRAVASHADRQTVQTLCGILLVDVESMNSNLPAPDAAANLHLANGLQHLGDGAHRCYDGAGGATTLLARSRTDRDLGLVELAEGISDLEASLGSPIPTTTTTTVGP